MREEEGQAHAERRSILSHAVCEEHTRVRCCSSDLCLSPDCRNGTYSHFHRARVHPPRMLALARSSFFIIYCAQGVPEPSARTTASSLTAASLSSISRRSSSLGALVEKNQLRVYSVFLTLVIISLLGIISDSRLIFHSRLSSRLRFSDKPHDY